ncbi:hypothetical protein [Prochlorococcus sp. MIT 1201]|uniref:hypothetical protein n=1 Tax=Prochlorococcus sp. MIT 1201 TaxID=3082535 RepID=UPI0039A6CD86
MPTLHKQEPVLDGRGSVVSYTRDPSVYYYRERVSSKRGYRSRKIDGAKTMDEAKRLAIDIAFEFSGRAPSGNQTEKSIEKRLRTQPIDRAVENFLEYERERLEAGLIKERTYRNKQNYLRNHLIPYLLDMGITKTRQIGDDTFSKYLIFRKEAKKFTLINEITVIKEFLSVWLVKKRLIEPEVVANKKLFPDINIKMTDLMANPAISQNDWTIINNEIRKWVRSSSDNINHRVHLWRTLFWHFTLISKNSGARPEELRKLRWRDVEVVDVGRISESKKQDEIEELKSEGIDLTDDGFISGSEWADSIESIGRETRLVAYITVSSSKTGAIREIPTNTGYAFVRWRDYLNNYYQNHYPFTNRSVKANDLVFGNVYNDKEHQHDMFGFAWRTIRKSVEDRLEGHKFSDKPYTIYSMRSTFIENKLIEGLDLFLLARIAGHDPKILLKHYERMNIRERAEEITTINYGKRKKNIQKVNLYNE